MTVVGAKALATALAAHPGLARLNVRENELGNAGARALAGVCMVWVCACVRASTAPWVERSFLQ